MQDDFLAGAEIVIDASKGEVWHALTDPDMIKQYLFGTQVESDWQVGSEIIYRGEWQGKPYQDKGRILELVPNQRLVSTFWSALSGAPDTPENYKTVTYELAPIGDQTRLVLSQGNNASQAEADHSGENWRTVLQALKELLEA
jgi:uncharacterized protein YndB with AHSA1/START domain